MIRRDVSSLSMFLGLFLKYWLRRTPCQLRLGRGLPSMWKLWALLKVIVFQLKFPHNRIPTRDNLLRRKVVAKASYGCSFCYGTRESDSHLFMLCDTTLPILHDIFRWIGWECVPHRDIHRFFLFSQGWCVIGG